MTKWYGVPQVKRDKTTLQAIPRTKVQDQGLQGFIDAVTATLETYSGRGQALDKAVTWRELKDKGLIKDDQRRAEKYNLATESAFCLASLEALEVTDIAAPDIAFKVPNNNEQGHFLVVYQEGDPAIDTCTLYVWDWNYAGAENIPYIVHAEQSKNGKLFSGAWKAIAGRYIDGNLNVSGSITAGVTDGLLHLVEQSADPADPADGQSVIWQSDGTGAGDDGDIMIKITAGGVTKTATLVDFSAV